MPKEFKSCIAHGGRVVTVKPNKGSYLPVCYTKAGVAKAGEIHKTGKKK